MSTLPRRTRAAILVAQHEDLVIDEIELPEGLEAGQVLVRVDRSGVCGSQVGEIDGVKGNDPHLPHLLGHEGCGVVLAIGAGVKHVGVGATVVLHWRKGAGIDSAPPIYRWRGERLNAGWVTTFNRHAVVSENRVTAIAPNTPVEIATLMGCPLTTGFGIVRREAAVTFADSVLVLGAGGVGSSVVMAAKLASAHPIIAVDRTESKLRMAAAMGATHTLRWQGAATAVALREIVGAAGADVVVENTGNPDVIAFGMVAAAARARIVLAGVPSGSTAINTLPLHFGQRVIGTHGGATKPDQDIGRYIEVCERAALPVADLVSDRYPLDGINEAIARLRRGDIAGRCLIDLGA